MKIAQLVQGQLVEYQASLANFVDVKLVKGQLVCDSVRPTEHTPPDSAGVTLAMAAHGQIVHCYADARNDQRLKRIRDQISTFWINLSKYDFSKTPVWVQL
ncbi:hypothetical protein ElyMa_006603400 [Elysia marginata]|uniref:Uncharacterized protein n=1 Tax=Elysia marginata TaxID=1093978 RepID=A0AAV4IEZ8_9GAST|nr:hypothetical protein ElyMa_006603400 [Elysia marginata]